MMGPMVRTSMKNEGVGGTDAFANKVIPRRSIIEWKYVSNLRLLFNRLVEA